MDHPLAALALGFLLGMRHATDPDHIVAVSAIVARREPFGGAWILGAVWGLGHTATIFALGGAIVLFQVVIPPRAGLGMELAVGLVLVALGALNLSGRLGGAPAPGDAPSHSHLRFNVGRDHLLRSLAVGLVHGLAGSGAVALLALAVIPDAGTAVLFLAIFGVGTLAGMLLITALMEASMQRLFRARRGAARWTTAGTGALSVVFGLWMIFRIGWVEGLFLGAAR